MPRYEALIENRLFSHLFPSAACNGGQSMVVDMVCCGDKPTGNCGCGCGCGSHPPCKSCDNSDISKRIHKLMRKVLRALGGCLCLPRACKIPVSKCSTCLGAACTPAPRLPVSQLNPWSYVKFPTIVRTTQKP